MANDKADLAVYTFQAWAARPQPKPAAKEMDMLKARCIKQALEDVGLQVHVVRLDNARPRGNQFHCYIVDGVATEVLAECSGDTADDAVEFAAAVYASKRGLI